MEDRVGGGEGGREVWEGPSGRESERAMMRLLLFLLLNELVR
jgi:hypothetical protein